MIVILAHGSGSGTVVSAVWIVSIVVYWTLWLRKPTSSVAPPVWWTLGMLALVAASTPWVEEAADRTFLGHMGQHLVLWVVAPPLLLAAHPFRTARRGGVELHSKALSSWSRRHPGWRFALAWVAVVVAMYGTHLTGLYDAALDNPWVHASEHAVYLASSVLLWSTVFGSGRTLAPARAGLAVATVGPLVLLGMVLTAAEKPLYGSYVEELGRPGALVDQRQGAALMWIGMMLAFVPLVVGSVWRWAQREQDAQERRERLEDRLLVEHGPTRADAGR